MLGGKSLDKQGGKTEWAEAMRLWPGALAIGFQFVARKNIEQIER